MNYKIEVVVPVYKGLQWIESSLDSLSKQSIDREKFHVTFVFNGEDDGSIDLTREYLGHHPDFPAVVLQSPVANAAAARNLGIMNSTATHATFVDVDDLISENYLELLYDFISPNVLPAALMVDLDEQELIDASTVIANEFLSQSMPILDPISCQRLLTFMVAKVIPIEWALESPLAENLRSGEDVAFFGKLITKRDFKISLWPGALGATYFRRKVPGSLSRKPPSRDFLVTQRCDVIAELSLALATETGGTHRAIPQSYMNSQASFIRRYLQDNPAERQSVMDEITARKIDNFPWKIISGTPEDLVIAYNFAPYTDTGATIVSKRIRQWARPVDIISNSMGATREALAENLILSTPYIAQHHELRAPASFSHPSGVQNFITLGLETFERLKKSGRAYKRIYSRSMWPASHFLAALIKRKYPELEWTAEFSDPVRLTTEGTFRTVPLQGTKLFDLFTDIVAADTSEVLVDNPDLYAWTELLPYLLADKLIFTNNHQLETMISYAPESLRQVVSQKAQIEIHPTLPAIFYEIGTPTQPIPNKINIGYFGDFYSTRGLQEVIGAIRRLDQESRDRIRVSIFTAKPPSDLEASSMDDLSDVISLGPKVSYLDFLATLNEFDVLIVNDASTKQHHDRNPYLPSKLSDYRGSRSKIWSICEAGSSLSTFDADFSSERGDEEQALEVLTRIANSAALGKTSAMQDRMSLNNRPGK